jgi:hypothetical protein
MTTESHGASINGGVPSGYKKRSCWHVSSGFSILFSTASIVAAKNKQSAVFSTTHVPETAQNGGAHQSATEARTWPAALSEISSGQASRALLADANH